MAKKQKRRGTSGVGYIGKKIETEIREFSSDIFFNKAKASAAGGLTTLAFDSSGKVIKELQPRRINNLPDTNAAFVVSDFFQSGINLNLAEGTTGGVTANRTHQMPTATEFVNNALFDQHSAFEFIIVNLDDEFNVEPTTNTGLTLIGSMRVSPSTSATFLCIRTSSKSATDAVTIVRAASDAFDPAEVGDITAVVAGTNLTGGATTGSATINLANASASAKGAVELATTAEADSGTDTARAITAAGLKSHVDARFSYQNISFTGQSTVPSDGDWMTVSNNGISNHTWNTNLGSGGTSVGSTTVTIPTGQICQGIIVPYDCVLVGFASLIRSVGNHQSKVGLAVGVPTYNDFATFDCTLRAYNAADISAGPDSNYSQRPVRADFLTANYAMSAGHVIFPLIGSVASNSRSVQWNCTLVLKTLIP